MPALKFLGRYPIEPVDSASKIKSGGIYALGIGTHTVRTFMAGANGFEGRYVHNGAHCDFHVNSEGTEILKHELKTSPLEVDDYFDIFLPKEADGRDNFARVLKSNGNPEQVSEFYMKICERLGIKP